MPWNERTPMDERTRFIGAVLSCEYTMTELCDAFEISRKTGYKWVARYFDEGPSGLVDRSRAPRSCPHRTDSRCERALVAARKRRPSWGPKKLLARLRKRDPDWPWPAVSTAGDILKRHGLVKPRRRRRKPAKPEKPRVETRKANQVWSADFKGEFRLGDRQLCYPLTVADHFSRFLLSVEGKPSTAYLGARPVFEAVFREYGLPEVILTDGGAPFASPIAVRRLSRLRVWWIKLGIDSVLIQPARPDQNGRHERMHKTLKAETARPPSRDAGAQQKRFDQFRREFNEIRPHEALDMRCPSEFYRPSSRPMPETVPEMEYPGHFEVRRVRGKGDVKWLGKQRFLSQALVREWVGFEEIDDGIWSVYFGSMLLGRYDAREDVLDLL